MRKYFLLTIFFIVIIFQSCSHNLNSEEIKNIKLESLISKIEMHNCNCDDSLLIDFELSVIKLEQLISKMDKDESTILVRKLIADSFNHLSRRYNEKNSSKSELYIDLRIQTLKDIISIGKYDPTYNKSYEELIKIYKSKKYNLTDFDNHHEFYDLLILKYSKMLNVDKYSQYQLTGKMSSLLQRAVNKQLTKKDWKYFNDLISALFRRDIKSTRYRRFKDQYAIELIAKVIGNYSLEYEQIKVIRRLAIIAKVKGFSNKENELESIIWWCEVRSIDDSVEQMSFLNQQMLSGNQLFALEMLVELGKVTEISTWSEKLEFEIPEELFEKSINQAQEIKNKQVNKKKRVK